MGEEVDEYLGHGFVFSSLFDSTNGASSINKSMKVLFEKCLFVRKVMIYST